MNGTTLVGEGASPTYPQLALTLLAILVPMGIVQAEPEEAPAPSATGVTQPSPRPGQSAFADPLWGEFMQAYETLQYEQARALGEQFVEKHVEDQEVVFAYSLLAGAYGHDDTIPKEEAEAKYKEVIDRGIAVAQRFLERETAPERRLHLLLSLGRLCVSRGVSRGWNEEQFINKGMSAYRKVIHEAGQLQGDEQRKVRAVTLYGAYDGLAWLHIAMHDFVEAEAVCREALARTDLGSHRGMIFRRLAGTYREWGKRVEEMETYRALFEDPAGPRYSPEVRQALVELYGGAVALAKSGAAEDAERCRELYERALDIVFARFRKSPHVLWEMCEPVADLLSDYYRGQNAVSLATEIYLALSRAVPDDARLVTQTLVKVAKIYEELGKQDQAVGTYRKVIEVGHEARLTMDTRLEALSGLRRLGATTRLLEPVGPVRERARPYLGSPYETLDSFALAAEQRNLEALYRCRSGGYLERNGLTDPEAFRAFWRDKVGEPTIQSQITQIVYRLERIKNESAQLPPEADKYVLNVQEGPELPLYGLEPFRVELVKEGSEWKVDKWADR